MKLSFSIALATNLPQYLIFSFFFAVKLCVIHTDEKFTKNKDVQIYIYVFTKDLPSDNECSHLK